MFGKTFSPELIEMLRRDGKGINNPMFGQIKSPATIAKLQKLVYVYEAETFKFIGVFSTGAKQFKMGPGKDTLTKYLNNKLPFKGKIFSRVQLD
jgi:hypothetical protein